MYLVCLALVMAAHLHQDIFERMISSSKKKQHIQTFPFITHTCQLHYRTGTFMYVCKELSLRSITGGLLILI